MTDQDLSFAPARLHAELRGERPFHVGLPLTIEQPAGIADRGPDVWAKARNADEVLDSLASDGEIPTIKAPNGERAHLKIIASTDQLVRDNLLIPLVAWEQDIHEFQANPALLFGHATGGFLELPLPPIGRVADLRLRKSTGSMEQWWRFHDVTDLSRELHALYAIGDMRAASVGFIIKQLTRVGDLDDVTRKKMAKKHSGLDDFSAVVNRAVLVETSAVPVGADPGALAQTVAGRALVGDDPLNVFNMGFCPDLEPARTFLRGMQAAERLMGVRFPEIREHYLELARACAGGDAGACALLGDGVDKERRVHITVPRRVRVVAEQG